MKTYNKLITLLAFIGLFSSCQKFVEGYEKDPNGIGYTVVDQEMTAVMLENQFFHKADGLRLAMMWLNQATGQDRQYLSLDDWNNASGSDFNGPWNEVYIAMSHADIVEKNADADGNIILRGLAKLFKAWAGGEAASLWGDVPFSQLNQYELYPDPAYEGQADVLDQVQVILDEAIADLNSGVGRITPERDIYFGGNTNKWVKIAHGLKARFYLHRKQHYDLALAEALQGPSDVSDDLYAKYDSNDDTPFSKWNPTKQFLEQRSGYLDAEDAFAKKGLLNPNSSDSRNNTKTTDNRGVYNYASDALNAASDGNGTGKFFGDMYMVTYGEMLLIATEAELRLHPDATGMANALTHYNTYRALLTSGAYSGGYWTGDFQAYDLTDFDAGGMENQDNIDPVQAFFRELFEERYIFFIGDYESFIDFARSFNDPLVPAYMKLHYDANGPLYSGQPLRFIYPQNEKDANASFPGMVDVNEALPLYQ